MKRNEMKVVLDLEDLHKTDKTFSLYSLGGRIVGGSITLRRLDVRKAFKVYSRGTQRKL